MILGKFVLRGECENATECKMVGWWEAAAEHREIGSVLCDDLEGWDREDGGRFKREGIWGHVYAYG